MVENPSKYPNICTVWFLQNGWHLMIPLIYIYMYKYIHIPKLSKSVTQKSLHPGIVCKSVPLLSVHAGGLGHGKCCHGWLDKSKHRQISDETSHLVFQIPPKVRFGVLDMFLGVQIPPGKVFGNLGNYLLPEFWDTSDDTSETQPGVCGPLCPPTKTQAEINHQKMVQK